MCAKSSFSNFTNFHYGKIYPFHSKHFSSQFSLWLLHFTFIFKNYLPLHNQVFLNFFYYQCFRFLFMWFTLLLFKLTITCFLEDIFNQISKFIFFDTAKILLLISDSYFYENYFVSLFFDLLILISSIIVFLFWAFLKEILCDE